MSKEWGRAALVLGIGGVAVWRSLTPEAKQRVGQFLDDLADAVVQARQRKQQQAQQELAAVPRALFQGVLERIARLCPAPG